MRSYIDNYVGKWRDDSGNRLIIRRISDRACMVDFVGGFTGEPIARPWYGGRPTVDMLARYYPESGPELIVDLWKGTCFSLHLNYDSGCRPEEITPEALAPSISRRDDDGYDYLEQYYGLLGQLEQFSRD